MKQIIVIKPTFGTEYDDIKAAIEQGLANGNDRIFVKAGFETEIEIIELPDTNEVPTIIHNTNMGINKDDLVAILNALMSQNGR